MVTEPRTTSGRRAGPGRRGRHPAEVRRLPDVVRGSVTIQSDVCRCFYVWIHSDAGNKFGWQHACDVCHGICAGRGGKDFAIIEANKADIVILRGDPDGAYAEVAALRVTAAEVRLADHCHGSATI